MGTCGEQGSTRWFYTGNQVGAYGFTGIYNFLGGGLPGSGISAGLLVPVYFPPPVSREPWALAGAVLDQKLLDASYPFIELNWGVEITLKDTVFRFSDKNLYIEDADGSPRFFEARITKAPSINITLGEWLNNQYEIGDLKLEVNNRDGLLNDWLPQGEKYTQWINAEVKVLVGVGERRDNYFELFTGYVTQKQGITSTEDAVTLKCYDKFDKDELPLPPSQFTTINYPDLQDDISGKGVPLVYGDWQNEVTDYGDIPAYCLNAKEESPTEYVFKVAVNALSSIGDIWLHRGERTADGPNGPIHLNDSFILKDPEAGQFRVPTSLIDVLDDIWIVSDKGNAGAGSGLNAIASDKPSTNFITLGVKTGDVVVKTATSERVSVSVVANNLLTLTGGATFNEGDEYSIITSQYTWRKGDKFSVKCVGKSLKRMSTNRMEDAGLGSAQPVGLSLDLDGNYWFADNATQKLYLVSLWDEVLRVINYADVSASLTNITGITVQTDNTLWLFDGTASRVFRYMLETSALGKEFGTDEVLGLLAPLAAGAGLTIDTGNMLYLVDNATGTFYKINPFASPAPTLVTTWNRSAFDAAAVETLDLSADVYLNQLGVVDRATGKFYRIDNATGAPISSFVMADEVSPDATWVVGVSMHQDGTVFFLNRATLALYNYNELADAQYNPGFIARDIVQAYTGKVASDFDINWNQACRESLSSYRARLYLADTTNAVTAVNKFLQQFNAVAYLRYGKYALFHIHFDNFKNDGDLLREGDFKQDTFNPSKEYSQYFNTAYAEYAHRPFDGKTTRSDTYASPAAIALADGKEVLKKLELKSVYRRVDIDAIMPLLVRLACAEPEFISVEITWRRLFTQLNEFFRINFDAPIDCSTGLKRGGRRFGMVPAFVRAITYDLEKMSMKLKLWSLGSTQFGDYYPVGPVAGGEGDKIVLTNLGSLGYVAPVGTPTDQTATALKLEDVDGMDAESRLAGTVGKAWANGYRVAIVDAATQTVVETKEILETSGQWVEFTEPLSAPITLPVKDAAGFIVSGHYLRHADYDQTTSAQKANFCHVGNPVTAYPTSSSQEIEEQRSGAHNFPDGRVPYIAFPEAYSP